MEKILKLKKSEIQKLSLKELISILESINSYFESNQENTDIELSLDLYKKSMEIMTYAKKKMILIKEEKEKIDEMYKNIISEE
ncbi:hypothetical protein OSSY52_21330 [Tepiditoga spiralis]|uniref:Uncharacterized protein n=1 Tax=Tepiditoga spiralis TaxID=2108365 RepID=A0A7G1GBU5_9BACT|nr:hypothetical protein [Tepiditoga spiralis]BBE31992.1 hypothetical protein OSSY52_21330 [Tepiditoga spiralis]